MTNVLHQGSRVMHQRYALRLHVMNRGVFIQLFTRCGPSRKTRPVRSIHSYSVHGAFIA